MKSNSLFLGVSLLVLSGTSAHIIGTGNKKPIKINNPILKTVDGIAGLMDKDHIFKSIIAGQMLYIFMDGGNPDNIPFKEIPFKGKNYPMSEILLHTFQGQPCTLKDLAKKEDNPSPADKLLLDKSLNDLKNKFEIMVSLILKEARGTKKITEKFIEDFVKQRNIPNSILVQWGQIEEGKEHESLQKSVTSHKIFYNFCEDLVDFLKAIVFSCDKARAQYLEWKKEQSQIKS